MPDNAPGPAAGVVTSADSTRSLDQRQRWRRGERVLAEDYLRQDSQLRNDPEAILDLLCDEIVLREEHGESPRLEEYLERFPQFAGQLRAQWEVHRLFREGSLAGPPGEAPTPPAPEQLPRSATPLPVPPGYEILGELGRGGMAVVYRARQLSLNRVVALKMILGGRHVGEDRRARFRTEAEAVACLHHPNIVQIHEVGDQDGLPYLVLEYVEGGTLAQYLHGTPLPARQAAELVVVLAQAVHHAHQAGIVHRDLKPANVLLSTQQSVLSTLKIADFGLAKRLDDEGRTVSGGLIGTPSYMAPEQYEAAAGGRPGRDAVGPAADVYALGAILYECLTGRPPFRAATPLETLRQVRDDEPVSPRQLQPGTARDLETICLKCLRKDPARRYPSAAALADDLRLFLADRPITARRAGRAERAWRWGRRNPALASLLGLVALLLLTLTIASTGVAILQYQRHQEAERARAEQGRALEALREAERSKTERLLQALTAQARANRMTRRPGQRFGTLRLITQAMELGGPSAELRTEAIAALSLPDVELVKEWDGCPAGTAGWCCDGRIERYARMDKDGNVSVRRMADDVEVAYRRGFGAPAFDGVKLSPDGRLLAQRCQPHGRLRLWDLGAPEQGPALEVDTGDFESIVAFRPDSRLVAVPQRERAVLLFDAVSGQARKLALAGHAERLAFHPTLPRLAVASGTIVRVLELASGKPLAELPHAETVTAVAWHPGGELLATGCNDHCIRLWDAAAGKEAAVFNTPGSMGLTLTFDPTGHLVLSNEWFSTLRLWETESGQERLTLRYTGAGYFDGAGRLLTDITGQPKLRLYRVATGREFRTLRWGDGAAPSRHGGICSTPSPDGRTLAVGVADGFALFDVATGRVRGHVPAQSGNEALRFEASGALLTCGPGGLRRWPISDDPDHPGRLRTDPPQMLVKGEPRYVRWGCSADAAVVALPAFDDGALLIHRGRSHRSLDLRPQQDVRSAAVSPDGHWVATGSHGCDRGAAAKVWDCGTGRLVKELPAGHLCGVNFSPDGKWLTTTGGGLRLWAVGTWEEGPAVGGRWGVFSTDSRLLAVGDECDVTRLVDPACGREYARLEPPEPTVPACFSGDGGQLILNDSAGQALHIWDLRAIRRELVKMHLDWDLPPFPPAPTPVESTPPDPTQ